jgi:hypothetical protein
MSVELPISPSLDQAYRAAVDDVNRWRGRCVELYARIERAIGETLLSVAESKQPAKRPPEMFGPRLKALRALVGPDGEHRNSDLAERLAAFDSDVNHRNLIVHASGRVSIDAKNNWLWSYRFDSGGKGQDVTGHIDRGEAGDLEKRLASTAKSLGARLANFRNGLKAVTE